MSSARKPSRRAKRTASAAAVVEEEIIADKSNEEETDEMEDDDDLVEEIDEYKEACKVIKKDEADLLLNRKTAVTESEKFQRSTKSSPIMLSEGKSLALQWVQFI